jgi:hypothetical protein
MNAPVFLENGDLPRFRTAIRVRMKGNGFMRYGAPSPFYLGEVSLDEEISC